MCRIPHQELQQSSCLCQLTNLWSILTTDFRFIRFFYLEPGTVFMNYFHYYTFLPPPFKRRKYNQDPYHPIGDSIWVHSHFWIDADKIPPKGLALELLPQGLPLRNITNINSRVLHIKQGTEKAEKKSLMHFCVNWSSRVSLIAKGIMTYGNYQLWVAERVCYHTLRKCPS